MQALTIMGIPILANVSQFAPMQHSIQLTPAHSDAKYDAAQAPSDIMTHPSVLISVQSAMQIRLL